MRTVFLTSCVLVIGGCDVLFPLDRPPSDGGGEGDGDNRDGGDDATLADCPASYTQVTTHGRYRFVGGAEVLGWDGARNACRSDLTGGLFTHLAVISSEAERLAVTPGLPGVLVSIGLFQLETMSWVTGEDTNGYPAIQLGELPWAPTEPSAVSDPACVHVLPGGRFDLGRCEEVTAWLCECDLFPDLEP